MQFQQTPQPRNGVLDLGWSFWTWDGPSAWSQDEAKGSVPTSVSPSWGRGSIQTSMLLWHSYPRGGTETMSLSQDKSVCHEHLRSK